MNRQTLSESRKKLNMESALIKKKRVTYSNQASDMSPVIDKLPADTPDSKKQRALLMKQRLTYSNQASDLSPMIDAFSTVLNFIDTINNNNMFDGDNLNSEAQKELKNLVTPLNNIIEVEYVEALKKLQTEIGNAGGLDNALNKGPSPIGSLTQCGTISCYDIIKKIKEDLTEKFAQDKNLMELYKEIHGFKFVVRIHVPTFGGKARSHKQTDLLYW